MDLQLNDDMLLTVSSRHGASSGRAIMTHFNHLGLHLPIETCLQIHPPGHVPNCNDIEKIHARAKNGSRMQILPPAPFIVQAHSPIPQ